MNDNWIPAPWRRRFVQLALGGTASIVVTAIATNLLRIVSSVTLTRLLDARAFGIVGIVTSVAIILQLVSDIGVLPFVVRHERGDDRKFLDEIWTLRLIRCTALTLIMVVIAIPVSNFLEKPEFALILAVWSLNFVIDGLSSMAFATAIREQTLWRLTLAELAASVAQLAIAVVLAVLLRSYWALLIAMLVSSVLKAVFSYTFFPSSRRRWSLSRERMREMWAFSRFIAPSSLMTVLILQADKVVLAKLMPLATYGLYAVAATLTAAGPALATSYARRVLYPAYADVVRTSPETLREVYYGKRRFMSLLYMAAMGAVGGGAQLIVAILYDARYLPVADYLQLLCISAALTLVNTAAEEVLIAAGNVRATLFANLTRMIWLVACVIATLASSQTMLLVAGFGLMEVAAMATLWFYLRRLELFNFREEIIGLMAAGMGAAIGLFVARVGFAVLPYFAS
jgi:O-antigen/teichoic acid export membrane protein